MLPRDCGKTIVFLPSHEQKQVFKVMQKHCPSWTLFLTKNFSTSRLSENQNTRLLGCLLLLFRWVLQHLITLMSLDWCFFLWQNVPVRHWFHKLFLRFCGKVKSPSLRLPSHFPQLNLNYKDNKLLAHQQWNWIILFFFMKLDLKIYFKKRKKTRTK